MRTTAPRPYVGAVDSQEGLIASLPERSPTTEPWERLAAALAAGGPEARDRERLCEEVCRVVVEDLGFSRALIATLDRKRVRLVTRAGYDPSIGAHVKSALRRLFTIPLAPRSDGKLLAGAWSVLEDEQVHVPDATAYSFRPDRTAQRSTLVRAFGTRGYVLTPIRGFRGPIGILAADRTRDGAPIGPEELARLRAVAAMVGLALEAAEAARGHADGDGERTAASPEERRRPGRSDRTAQMQAVLDSLHEAVLVLGPDGELRYLNRAAAALLDFLPWEAMGRSWREILPVSDPEAFADLIGPGTAGSGGNEKRWTLLPGLADPVTVRVESLPLASVHAGRGTALFLEDVTHEVEEEKIRGEFLSMLVHDLSAPLQSVLGFAELLLLGRGGELSESQRDFISRIQGSGRFMARLVEDILEVTELESGRALLEPETLDARALVDEVVEGLGGLAERSTVELVNELPADLPRLDGDRIRLRQALQNVVTNAIEASSAGSRVRIQGETFRRGGEPWLRLRVVDAGVGLPEEVAAHLFDKYRSYGRSMRRGRRSRGLGLPIARLVVTAHGGEIRAEGEPGVGTTITLELPLSFGRRHDGGDVTDEGAGGRR